MTSISFPAWRRWLVPICAAIAVMLAGVTARAVSALARPELPAMSAEQLLAAVQTARPDGLSGTIGVRADLGLPELPGLSAGFGSLLSGSHTVKVWYSSPDSLRVALIGKLSETSIITNGRDVWTWSSDDNAATHAVRPAGEPERKRVPDPASLPVTPEQAAAMVLAAVGPSTSVTTAVADRVAGRAAYELVLAPRDTESLVGQIRIAVDSERFVPLRVRVFARGAADPAFEVGFTSVDFARPDPSWFTFTPPAGAKVTECATPALPGVPLVAPLAALASGKDGKDAVTIGSGWTAVQVVRVPVGANHTGRDDLGRLLRQLPRVEGGRVLGGSLFTVLLTDDGRLLFGAVSAERLAKVAADPAAQPKPGS